MTRHTASFPGLLAALLIASAPAHAQDAAKASRFYEDALQRYEKRDIPGTIIQLRNALQADKTQLPVQVLLGRALMADGQAVAAEVSVTEALKLGVDRAEVVVTLGQALLAQGKQAQLIEQPRMATTGLPNSVRMQVLLIHASAYADLGAPANALKAIEEARAIDRDAPESWLAEVPLRLRARQLKEAALAADMALKLAPSSAEAQYQHGTVLHMRGDIAGATADYTKALSLDADHLESRLSRAAIHFDARRDAEANADIDAIRKRFPKEPRAAYLRALLAERNGDRVAAKAALGEVVALLDPVPIDFIKHRPQILLLAGLAHYGLEEFGKAKPFLELVLRGMPASPVSKLVARIAMQEKEPDRAIAVLEPYLRSSPSDSQALVQLAAAHIAKGRPGKASQLMQDALKAKEAPAYQTVLGIAMLRGGDPATAKDQLLAAFKKDPRQAQAGMTLVALLLKEGQPTQAATIAEQLLRQQPANSAFLTLAGVAKAEAGDYGVARRHFEAALAADAKLMTPRLGLARLDIASRSFESASRRLKAILKDDERNTEAMYDMAALQERLGKIDDAKLWLQRAAEASGKVDTQSNVALVELNLRARNLPAAMDAAKLLLAKQPEDVQALSTYAKVQLASGDIAGARQTLVSASRRAAFDTDQQTQVAAMQLTADDLAGAAYSLDKALSSQPDALTANGLMTEVDIRRKEFGKAEARAKRIVQLKPGLALGHQLLGDIAGARGQPAAALDAYRQAFKLQPASATALPLMRLLSSQDKTAELRTTAERWLKTNPNDMAVHRLLGDHFARHGDFAGARAIYEAAAKLPSRDAELLNNLANVHLQLGAFKAARDVAQQALTLAPNNPLVIDTLGWALHNAGESEAALQKLRDARLRAPNNPEIRYHLAVALAKGGKKGEARDELAVALRDNPHFESRNAAKALFDTLK